MIIYNTVVLFDSETFTAARVMYELLNEMLECTEFVSHTMTSDLAQIIETWEQCSRLYASVVEKINVIWRAPLDSELLEEFPDVRTKVAKKLEQIGDNQLSILQSLIERMFKVNECLKIKLNRINNTLEHISFEEHNNLKHVIREHVIWIEDCWTCFHCLYMQIEFAMISLEVLNEKSADNLINAIKQDEKDKSIVGKSKTYMQSCLSLLKFLETKNKIKINSE